MCSARWRWPGRRRLPSSGSRRSACGLLLRALRWLGSALAERAFLDVFLGVLLPVLRFGPAHDVERLGDRVAVLFGGALDVLVGDVGRAHLAMSIHAATRQTHRSTPSGADGVWGPLDRTREQVPTERVPGRGRVAGPCQRGGSCRRARGRVEEPLPVAVDD